jgi:phosphoribosylanthranilate isomerase
MPVRIKICGITSEADAQAAVAAGADALGLNLYEQSPRCISEAMANAIVASLPPFVEPVGLFVKQSWDRIAAAAQRLGLQTVQVHGDRLEPCPVAGLAWLPAFAIRAAGDLQEISAFVARCPHRPSAVLVDAHVAGVYGGTGQVAPWRLLTGFNPGVPVILAGGLTPDNVAEAIRVVRPYAVDVASGVEASPGRKDPDKIRRFIAAARAADA